MASKVTIDTDGLDGAGIKDLTVTTAKIAALDVTTAKIADLNVTTGKIAALNVTTAKIADLNVTRGKLEALGQQLSSSCGAWSTTSTSFSTVTNLSVSITTTGRPVFLILNHEGSSSQSWIGVSGTPPASMFRFTRAGGEIARFAITRIFNEHSTYSYVDIVGAGTYTYTFQGAVAAGGPTLYVNNLKLLAYEL